MRRWNGLIEEYKEWLPVTEKTPALTLQEGNTPLIHLTNLSEQWGINLYVKTEGTNPTGSFKDRGHGYGGCKSERRREKSPYLCIDRKYICICSGIWCTCRNADNCCYSRRYESHLGNWRKQKCMVQKLLKSKETLTKHLDMVREAGEGKVALVNSVNPYRLEGQKTIAFETIEQLGKVPDVFALPVGNAGNISAAWKGFKEYADKKGTALRRIFLVFKQTELHRLSMTVYLKILKQLQLQSESEILQVGNWQ